MAAILGPGGPSMATSFAADGPGGPVVAGDQLRRDRINFRLIYRRANYFRGYKILRILKILPLNKNFVEKFRGYGQSAKVFTARS